MADQKTKVTNALAKLDPETRALAMTYRQNLPDIVKVSNAYLARLAKRGISTMVFGNACDLVEMHQDDSTTRLYEVMDWHLNDGLDLVELGELMDLRATFEDGLSIVCLKRWVDFCGSLSMATAFLESLASELAIKPILSGYRLDQIISYTREILGNDIGQAMMLAENNPEDFFSMIISGGRDIDPNQGLVLDPDFAEDQDRDYHNQEDD